MATREEEDYPVGHPARFDYDPATPEAKEYARKHSALKGERDYPVDHPKAVDTPGSTNHLPIVAGVDPLKPELEAFTGRTPQQARRIAKLNEERAKTARESITPPPVEAPAPPPPGDISEPHGQPDPSTRRKHNTGSHKGRR